MLVIGGSRVGQGMQEFVDDPRLELLESDVSFGPRTSLICDAHQLPLADGSVDAVVIQGVLQALLDPQACVAEIHRVLEPGGYVYAETPFMQQVCVAPLRLHPLHAPRPPPSLPLVRRGAAAGRSAGRGWRSPGRTSTSCSASSSGRRARTAVKGFTRVTAFWLKYFDQHLIDRPGGIDAASGVYFLGRRSETPLPDGELIAQYRGAVSL